MQAPVISSTARQDAAEVVSGQGTRLHPAQDEDVAGLGCGFGTVPVHVEGHRLRTAPGGSEVRELRDKESALAIKRAYS